MNNIKDLSATELAFGKFFTYNFNSDDFPGKEYIDTFDDVTLFTDAVKHRVAEIGFEGDTNDVSAVASYIFTKCKSEIIDINRQTIVNWLVSGMPANSTSGRDNVYKLCFALDMNALRTADFFLKAYLERPFNYKNIHEAVYFFCMNNNLRYTDAVRIINHIESMPVVENPDADDITEQIGHEFQKCNTEEDLINYISENRSGFHKQNKTATEKIQKLINSCMKLAEEESKIVEPNRTKKINSTDALLSTIYGYSAKATEGYDEKDGKLIPKQIYKESISDSKFPQLIKRNFPQGMQLSKILKGTASHDIIRKTLIMLNFYNFYAQVFIGANKADEGLFDEFVDEMNILLAECGYVQLYWRNPYDWMIGYCACAEYPLDELRGLIREYYLEDPSIYNE